MPESAAPVDTSTAGIAGDAEGEKEREAKEILPYILLHRSRSHHFDLRAELAEWRGTDGSLRVKTDDIFSLRRRYDVLMQVAVEYQLKKEPLSRICGADPALLRYAYDTVYYLSHLWESGDAVVSLTQTDFDQHLERRARSGDEPDAADEQDGAQPGPNGAGATPGPKTPMTIGPGTRSDLFNIARSIAKALANPEKFCEDIGHYQERTRTKLFEEKVLGTIRSLPPLLAIDNDTVNWKFDFWGRGLDTRASAQFLQGGELERTRGLIDRFALHLKELGLDDVTPETLAHRFHILPSQPTWTKVQEAIALAGDVTDPDDLPPTVAAAISDIREYTKQLRETLPTVAQALFCGWILGTLALRDPFASDAHRRAPAEGLAVLDAQLRLRDRGPQQTRDLIREVTSGIVSLVGAFLPEAAEVLDPTAADLATWRQMVDRQSRCMQGRAWRADLRDLPIAESGWWTWHDRFQQRLPWQGEHRPAAAELLCAAAKAGPSAFFSAGPAEASPREWGAAAAKILSQSSATDRVPTWIIVPALVGVGFGSALPTLLAALGASTSTANPTELQTATQWVSRLPRTALQERSRRAPIFYHDVTLADRWSGPLLPTDAALLIAAADASALASDAVRAAFRFERWAYEFKGSDKDIQKIFESGSKPTATPAVDPALVKAFASLPSAVILGQTPPDAPTTEPKGCAVQPAKIEDILAKATA